MVVANIPRVVANYMMWRVVQESLPRLSEDWRNLLQEFCSVVSGKKEQEPRWDTCIFSFSEDLGVALGYHYVKHYFNEENMHGALEMVHYIHKAYLNMLERNDWMDEKTKTKAIEKANAIMTLVGYPKELMNDSFISEYYKNLTLNNISYFDNMRKIKKWSVDKTFSRLRKPNKRGEWNEFAEIVTIVNAYYTETENTITTLILEVLDILLAMKLHMDSIIRAWCDNLRPEMLKYFILSMVHSPQKFRVNGAISNQPEFAKEFGCRADSTMNPRKKCEVW
ncbi:neprilysin-2-like [Stegodyphus dumicola]|uniref:neprilysin-2-like n=1 Tax=Stegodyphus dumicola TaxID=202533 RepID=UPI0015AD3BBD|nr:neprilysin-2-like [Stegodyphus dumicola]